MQVTAIIVAAGKGRRFKSKTPKPLARIAGKPVIVYSLEALIRHPSIKEIIVVANPLNIKAIAVEIRQRRMKKITCVALGGRRRQDSVHNGLKFVDPRQGLVLVHDAARPFIDKKMISASIKAAANAGAAIVGVPVKATIKKVQGKNIVEKTINREGLWEIQTRRYLKRSCF